MIERRNNYTPWNQALHQQDSIMRWMNTAMNAYINFLRVPLSFYQIPLSFYRMEVDETRIAIKQASQLTEQATRQATDATTKQVKQLTEHVTQQVTEVVTQQVKELALHTALQATEAATEQVKQLAAQAAEQATAAATEQVKQMTEQATRQATEAATQHMRQLAEQVATQQGRQLAEQAALQMAQGAGTAAQNHWEQARLWTFEHPLTKVESYRPVRLQVNKPGIAHAGINRDGKWIRIYDVPLEAVSPDVWEAYLLDPEINEFTFIWYDPDKPGQVYWEGKNYQLLRQDKSGQPEQESTHSA